MCAEVVLRGSFIAQPIYFFEVHDGFWYVSHVVHKFAAFVRRKLK